MEKTEWNARESPIFRKHLAATNTAAIWSELNASCYWRIILVFSKTFSKSFQLFPWCFFKNAFSQNWASQLPLSCVGGKCVKSITTWLQRGSSLKRSHPLPPSTLYNNYRMVTSVWRRPKEVKTCQHQCYGLTFSGREATLVECCGNQITSAYHDFTSDAN